MSRNYCNGVFLHASMITGALGVISVVAYSVFGHALIEAMYNSNLAITDKLMRGKAVTPLEAYFANLDQAALRFGIYLVLASLIGLALSTDLVGVSLAGCSFLIFSFFGFCLLEAFPVVIKPLRLDIVPYYAHRITYLPDPVFGFRERPFHKAEIANFRGYAYSPVYGIDVSPHKITWMTDEEGFRNEPDVPFANVVVIGSSYTEYGDDLQDTFPKRLERKLDGRKVLNFGKAGYGPLQYVEVLKKYALKKKPAYALLLVHPPADTEGQLADWISGREDYGRRRILPFKGGLFFRYRVALEQSLELLISTTWTGLQLGLQRIGGTEFVHPDVTVLRLPNYLTKQIVFTGQHSTKSPEELLSSPEWTEFKRVLMEFKNVTKKNEIVPIMIYVPAATEIYAEYSTSESGWHWLKVRESQIATSRNTEEAVSQLCRSVGVQLISLVPAFRRAAQEGKLIFYPIDSHWNAEGREIAAKVTAEALKARPEGLKNPDNAKPKAQEKGKRPYPGTQQAAFDGKRTDNPAAERDDETLPKVKSPNELELLNDSAMARSIDGTIKFWNRRAEELYGWKKEEAIGKVSHDLLQTQFPKALEEIDSELVRKGRWEGKLVHTTRDGGLVVVESRWILDRKGQPGAVVEINTRSADF